MTKIKICGIKNLNEAKEAFNLGADYLGLLVDIPNTNLSVDRKQAKEIIEGLRDANFVILTVEDREEKILELLNHTSPWGVQILKPSKKIVSYLKDKTTVKIIPVVHVIDKTAESLAAEFKNADFILLDSKIGNQLGGTGITHDWEISKRIIENSPIPVFLAGGLNISNVSKAIKDLNPYAVDVESSLRNSSGFRDMAKVKDFILKSKAS